MAKKNPKTDAYILKAAPFAKPILNHLRSLVHKACPEVEETIKWGFPHFDYKGSMMCSMAAFKQHCAFGFWKAALMNDFDKKLQPIGKTAMGDFGRISSLKDLPKDSILIKYIKEAIRLNDEGITLPAKTKETKSKTLIIPPYFKKQLATNKKAEKVFNDFAYSHKKEYVQWVTEAKTEETREKRMKTTIEWLSEGKGRNWKYEKKK